jgi:hypothetical protein
MKREALLEKLQNKLKYTVEGLQHDILIVEKMKRDKIYRLPLYGESLIKVQTYNDESIRLRVLANKDGDFFTEALRNRGFSDDFGEKGSYLLSVRIGSALLDQAVEVPVENLPLYVSWKFLSPEFTNIVKGYIK